MNKQVILYSYYGIRHTIKKEKKPITNTYDIEKSHTHYVKRKKPNTKEYIVYDSIYAKFKERTGKSNPWWKKVRQMVILERYCKKA